MTSLRAFVVCALALLLCQSSGRAEMEGACLSAVGPETISKEIEELVKSDETRTTLPANIVDRWFRGCSFDHTMKKLATAGFQVGEYDKIPSWQTKQGIKRVANAEKKLGAVVIPGTTVPIGAHLLRATLFDYGGRLDIKTLIYVDTP